MIRFVQPPPPSHVLAGANKCNEIYTRSPPDSSHRGSVGAQLYSCPSHPPPHHVNAKPVGSKAVTLLHHGAPTPSLQPCDCLREPTGLGHDLSAWFVPFLVKRAVPSLLPPPPTPSRLRGRSSPRPGIVQGYLAHKKAPPRPAPTLRPTSSSPTPLRCVILWWGLC